MIGIVVSRADEASVLVGECLLEVEEWDECRDGDRRDAGGDTCYRRDGFELRTFDGLHLHLGGVAETFDDPDLVVFVSRHAGETGPLLSAHFTGNVGPAEYGGRPNELARACPNAHALVLESLSRYAPGGYGVGVECTHHGPSEVGAPSMFVEVGSAEPQWRDPEAAEAVARAVLDLRGVSADRERTVVGFGGGHYAPRFSRIVRETDWAIGHVVADWAIEAAGADGLPGNVIDQTFERSAATLAVVDGDRPGLAEAIEDRGYRVVGETWIRETAGVPLALVERAEALLCSIDDGLRFGDRRVDERIDERDDERTDDLAVLALNPDLVGAALGVDSGATRRAIESHAVAFEAEEAGNRPTGRILLPDGDSGSDSGDDSGGGSVDTPFDQLADSLLDSLVSVLRSGGAAVERHGDEIVVHESTFDPVKARELDVPEGPAFGQLANDEAIEVEGKTVTPEAVRTTRTRRYPIRRASH